MSLFDEARSASVAAAAAAAAWRSLAWSAAGPAQDAKQDRSGAQGDQGRDRARPGEVSRDQVERDRLARELRTAEMSVSDVRQSLERVRQERAEHAAQARRPGRGETQARRRTWSGSAKSLAGQLRAAYLIGREEPLKLLLNQKDPTRAGRMFAYYSYFGRARAEQIDAHRREPASASSSSTARWPPRTSGWPRSRPSASEELGSSTGPGQRGKVLASLQAEAKIARAEPGPHEAPAIRPGEAAARAEARDGEIPGPVDTNTAFGRLRGKLAWPVAGRLVARFGEDRAGGAQVGRRAGRHRAGRRRCGPCPRAGWSTRTGCRA